MSPRFRILSAAMLVYSCTAVFSTAALPDTGQDDGMAKPGLAILQGVSFTPPARPGDDYWLQCRIVAVIEQPAQGKAVGPDDTTKVLCMGDAESMFHAPPSIHPDVVFLRTISWSDGTLQAGTGIVNDTAIPVTDSAKDPERIAQFERKGLQEVLKLRAGKTRDQETVAFASMAASTPTPSWCLIVEGYDLRGDTCLSDDERMKLAEGAVSLMVRPDAPLLCAEQRGGVSRLGEYDQTRQGRGTEHSAGGTVAGRLSPVGRRPEARRPVSRTDLPISGQ